MKCSGEDGFAGNPPSFQSEVVPEEVLLVLSSWPDLDGARTAARLLVEERCIACANIIPAIESIYRWKEKIEISAEVLLLMKTTFGQYPALELRIKQMHPYQVPEVLCFPVSAGFAPYLSWVEESCGS
jgi:periplasmic divalent cation tolerance protein